MIDDIAREQVTSDEMRLAETASRWNWTLSEVIKSVQQAWIYAHEDKLKQAHYQVEQSLKK